MLDFVLVIPTLNEEGYIEEMVVNADRALRQWFRSYRIVVVDESSRDRTTSKVRKLMRRYKSLRLIEGRTPGNRGRDVQHGMSKFVSKLYFYIDADLTPTLPYIPAIIKEYEKGYDLVTGSRYLRESKVRRPPLRTAVSKGYNLALDLLFWENVKDHQCGFKLFSRKAFLAIEDLAQENHWMWDVETILITQHSGMRVREVPIAYVERRSNRTPVKRLLKDITIHGPGILRLYYRFRLASPESRDKRPAR